MGGGEGGGGKGTEWDVKRVVVLLFSPTRIILSSGRRVISMVGWKGKDRKG